MRFALAAALLFACTPSQPDAGLDAPAPIDAASTDVDALPNPGCPGATSSDPDATNACPAALPMSGAPCGLAAEACCTYGVTECGGMTRMERRCVCTAGAWYCPCVSI